MFILSCCAERRCYLPELDQEINVESNTSITPVTNAEYKIGNVLKFSCKNDGILIGNQNIFCNENASWSGSFPANCSN